MSESTLDATILEGEAIADDQGRWLRSKTVEVLSVAGAPKRRVLLKDDTLRSGANTPRVYATNDDRLRIAERLEMAGIREIEAGYPGIPEHRDFVGQLKASGCKMRLGAHVALRTNYREMIDRAVEAGFDVVNIVAALGRIYAPGRHSEGRYKEEEVLDRIHDAVAYSKEKGMFTAIGGRGDRLDDFARTFTAYAEAGADRVCIYDGRGWSTPEVFHFLVKYARALVGPKIEIDVHCHDDFGLATANTLAAFRAGAQMADVTVNSTGHKCGNAALEQVAVALEVLYGTETGIDLSQLYGLCKLVEEVYGMRISSNRPIVGENMYTYAGWHLSPIVKGQWYIWENIKAEAVGNRRSILWGPTTDPGRNGPIQVKLDTMGLKATDNQLDRIYADLMDICRAKKYATDDEMERIIQQVID
ncbi:MAG: hypothetical protein HYX92_20645 [Chloroflexi bacterium]|nr:hypothetical protein [Chloroflexota bacterium]